MMRHFNWRTFPRCVLLAVFLAVTLSSVGYASSPPVVDPGGPYTGIAGQPVQFDASGTSDPEGDSLVYLWDFGDGSPPPFPSEDPTATHTYASPGTYTAQLAVTDRVNPPVLVEVAVEIFGQVNQPPVADPDGPYAEIAGEPVQFDGSGSFDPDGTIVTYDWDFGDGHTGTGVSPTHTYAAAGTYTVTLFVTDDGGATDAAGTTSDIAVAAGLPPDCSHAMPSIDTLWPPNHKIVLLEIDGITDPDGDPVTVTVTGISQDEPVKRTARGSGSTLPDGVLVDMDGDCSPEAVGLRSERDGRGNGRVYVISFIATDPFGEECSGTVQVCVPHNKKSADDCIDDGQVYDSMAP